MEGSSGGTGYFRLFGWENKRPQPFPVKFTTRSDRIREIIVEEAKVARGIDDGKPSCE